MASQQLSSSSSSPSPPSSSSSSSSSHEQQPLAPTKKQTQARNHPSSSSPFFLPGGWTSVTLLSSLVLRACSFFFLRWIPGHHFVPVVLGALLLYGVGVCFVGCWEDTPRSLGVGVEKEDDGSVGLRGVEMGKEKEKEKKKEKSDKSEKINPKASASEHSGVLMAQFGEASSRRDRRDRALRTLFTGVPDRRALVWSWVTISVNVLLASMVLDLVFRAPLLHASDDLSFTRVGYVDGNSAKILVREPDLAKLPVELSYRAESEQAWKMAELLTELSNETDYTHSWTLRALRTSTKYDYSTSNGHSGAFQTAPRAGYLDPRTSKFTFLATSCLKAHFPYNPLSHPLSISGLDYLANLLPELRASFMLFLGDFIYADVPLQLGYSVSNYRREYRQVYASPSWPSVSRELPWLHVIDDHEIQNDWDAGDAAPYPAAIEPFNIYHHSLNPPPVSPNASYYSFIHGPASFFLLDARRHRSPSAVLPANDSSKTMLGSLQLEAVRTWLARPEPKGVRWKILVSSVPFTRNWRVNAADTWAGYLEERQILLEAMWDAASGPSPYGVIVLSGDRHEFAATRFPAPAVAAEGQPAKSSKPPMPAPPVSSIAPSIWGVVAGSPLAKARNISTGSARTPQHHRRATWPPGTAVHEFSCSPLNMFYLPLRSYWEVEGEQSGVGAGGEDQRVAYIPDGNSKFGAVEIENAVGGGQSVLRYRLFVDGKERWNYVVTAG